MEFSLLPEIQAQLRKYGGLRLPETTIFTERLNSRLKGVEA